jgi:hydrogenase-4 component B
VAVTFSYPIVKAFLRLDPLAAFFALIIGLGGLLAAIYSLGYMKIYRDGPYSPPLYYFFMGLLVAAMLLVVTAQNALLFLIVWEIMSLASFFLVSFEHHKEEVRRVGLYYLIAMQVGAAFLLTAFAWVTTLANSLDFADLGSILGAPGSISTCLFLLFLIGFGCKAGLLPLHTWLPLAHPAAPTGVSALMSGVMIKTGIYGILRIITIGGVPNITLAYLVFGVALVSGIFGVMNAIVQHDLKKLLAYHSIENIGIIGIGIGLGMLGIAYRQDAIALCGFLGGLLHVFNHFTFKSLLFYGAGVVYTKTHTRDIEKLGGLIHYLPVTAILFLIASLAISGLPLFSGFISEFAIYTGLVRSLAPGSAIFHVAVACGLAGLAFIGILALLCFTKVFSVCFLGLPRVPPEEKLAEGSVFMLTPMIVLGVIIVIIGLFPLLALPLLKNVVGQFVPRVAPAGWENIMALFGRLSLALIVLGGLILFFVALRRLLLRGKEVTIFKTWDCGYQVASSRMSYTGSSFAAPLMYLIAPFIPQHIKAKRPRGLFPRDAHYESHHDDFIAFYLVNPLISSIRWLMAMFTWMQSGRTQQYILYGLVFLIILIIWIMVMP